MIFWGTGAGFLQVLFPAKCPCFMKLRSHINSPSFAVTHCTVAGSSRGMSECFFLPRLQVTIVTPKGEQSWKHVPKQMTLHQRHVTQCIPQLTVSLLTEHVTSALHALLSSSVKWIHPPCIVFVEIQLHTAQKTFCTMLVTSNSSVYFPSPITVRERQMGTADFTQSLGSLGSQLNT